jgi:hypothetical protein
MQRQLSLYRACIEVLVRTTLLQRPHLRVDTVVCQKLCVVAPFNDVAGIHH